MRKIGLVVASLAAMFAMPAGLTAQMALPVQLGLSAGAAFPTGELGRDDAFSTGWGFEVNAVLRAAPAIGIYAAYDRYNFEFDRDVFFGLGQQQGDMVDQGFAGGVIISVPTGGFSVGPWIRGGAVYNSVEFDYDNIDDDPESDPGLGFEVGAGLELPLGYLVSIVPSARYRSYAPEINGSDDFTISYLVGELGFTFRF